MGDRIFKLPPGHPALQGCCAVCGVQFQADDECVLDPRVPVEPGSLTWEADLVHRRCGLQSKRLIVEMGALLGDPHSVAVKRLIDHVEACETCRRSSGPASLCPTGTQLLGPVRATKG